MRDRDSIVDTHNILASMDLSAIENFNEQDTLFGDNNHLDMSQRVGSRNQGGFGGPGPQFG